MGYTVYIYSREWDGPGYSKEWYLVEKKNSERGVVCLYPLSHHLSLHMKMTLRNRKYLKFYDHTKHPYVYRA